MPGRHLTDEEWRRGIEAHRRRFRLTRALWKALPTDPRCKLCAAPFAGVGRVIARPFGYAPSRKNPKLCDACVEHGPKGGFEVECGILFADVRGFTGLSATMRPAEVAALATRFYEAATASLIRHDAIVDKFVGDQVMAIFWPLIVDGDTCEVMVTAAEELLGGVASEADGAVRLEVGVGIDYGTAYVGNVGGGAIQDFTALGDVVNTAARLQAAAEGGQIVVSERVWRHVGAEGRTATRVELELKGKAERVPAYVVEAGATRASAGALVR